MTVVDATELSVQGESIQKLYNDYQSHRFLVNRRYQRKLVWAVEEKSLLIDSVIKKLPIPLILLAEAMQDDSPRLEIIDGLQRLNALFAFIENEFPVEGKYFDLETLADTKILLDKGDLEQKSPVLERDICRQLSNYQLPVSTYKSASESSVDEVFRRINSSGRYLSLQEIRQAGSLTGIAGLVRRISATVRGDASLTEYVSLEDMPKISITNKELNYGIYDASIFWIEQGILAREAVRESRDEELVLDLLLDIILDPLATTGTEYRDAAYGNERRRGTATAARNVQARLAVIGEDEVERRFVETLDLIKITLDEAGAKWSEWTVTQQNPRGVPRYFHAVFIAICQLLNNDGLAVRSHAQLAGALKGFWDRDITIPGGGGNWGAERKVGLIDSVKALLSPHFEVVQDEHKKKLQEQALEFEATLRMALTEEALFELKQGFCRIDKKGKFDEGAFEKMLKIASAMANSSSDVPGVIYYGVADDGDDAEKIKRFAGISIHAVDKFYVTGTQHELDAMKMSIDEFFRWFTDKILASKLDQAFARRLSATLKPFRYKDHLLWKLEPLKGAAPVAYDGVFYDRIGPQLNAVTDPTAIVELVRRF
ncbi:DUF262 domain-containing protein [Amycolatopsis sp. NPDC049159]|uniref:GmrSD restriction endonuclease domain-containing protein n=1 Tax=Amycolatopsis sp. NPDC049159 TaxID=3157210 RepID=UPI00340F95FA